VHTEHLLLGLYAKPDGPARRFLDAREALDAVLTRALGVPVADLSGTAPALWEFPGLSAHVRSALERAGSTAGSPPIRSRHLLLGLLSVTECDVTRALAEAGITGDGFRQWLVREEQPARGPLAGGIDADRVDPTAASRSRRTTSRSPPT
jgi:ATP-dependent Clp protease ATP-binding subunit ClpA